VVSWYGELAGFQKRTFWACYAGWTLDAMNAQIFSFLIPTLMALWKINSAQAGYLGTAVLIATGVGGWIAGVLADRYGRVRIMQFSIIWFALSTFVGGFALSYNQMLFVRMLQGIGFGGEWGAGAVLMGETIRPEHRGKAVGTVQSGYGIGWALATVLSTAAFLWLPQAWAWRALLWFGAVPALFVIYIQRNVKEPAVFLEARTKRQAAGQHQPGFLAIFHRSILRTTVLSSLLALGVIGAGSAIIPWLPAYMKLVKHLSVAGVGTFMMFVTVGAFFGFLGSAYLGDFVGRRRNFLFFCVMSWLVVLGYMYLPLSHWEALLLSFPFGFFTQGSYATLGPYFTELFPTSIRAAGQSFSYNFGKGAGAVCVATVGWLAKDMSLGTAIGVVSLCAYLVAIIATLLLPETRGMRLSADDGVLERAAPNELAETVKPEPVSS
jgi:MFS family permease